VELTQTSGRFGTERAKVNLSMKNYEDARADGERAATLRDTRGVILDLQIYALQSKFTADSATRNWQANMPL